MTDAALDRHDIALVRADNPGAFTLTGTNTWLVGRDPCWIVDPGPELDAHVDAVLAEAQRRGGVGGIALTHDHGDHSDAADAVRERAGRPPIGAARWDGADVALRDGDAFGPFAVVATGGHAPDHLAFVKGRVGFTGDAVLGSSSVFVAPDPGSLRTYLGALRRLRTLELTLLCPGHGAYVTDPAATLDDYIDHRLDRERRVVAALEDGLRSIDDLLDRVWDDAPPTLRLAAMATLMAHLGKLEEEGLLPADVQRAMWPPPGGVTPM
jgi:glyoxylase-like metal-dependent hydrolase (beta-lactamase superfamily II)